VKTSDGEVVVLLTDETKVGQREGLLKVRRKGMSMAALIPGLQIQAEGTYNAQRQLVAKSLSFDGSDLERAQSVQAGLHEVQGQAERNREEIEKHREKLTAHEEELANQQERLKVQQERLTEQQAQLAAHQEKIAAAVARFGQLDDYYILDEVTVLFGNGKTNVESSYKPKLLELARNAKNVEGYMIQVTGHASSVGSVALNQKLSQDRAGAVTNVLIQEGNIPLTNLLAPGAMGVSRPVADDKTAEGQAQNRRVVVRVLQNKGIAGMTKAQ